MDSEPRESKRWTASRRFYMTTYSDSLLEVVGPLMRRCLLIYNVNREPPAIEEGRRPGDKLCGHVNVSRPQPHGPKLRLTFFYQHSI